MKPTDASKKSKEKEVYSNLQDTGQKQRPRFQQEQLVRIADVRKVFSKGDSTNWSYKLYTITEVLQDTTPGYRLKSLLERYNQNLLLPTKLTFDENKQIMKEVSLIQ